MSEFTDAVDAYTAAFDEGPPLLQMVGDEADLLSQVRAAVVRGAPITEDEITTLDDLPEGAVI